jgi:hypothetical protein
MLAVATTGVAGTFAATGDASDGRGVGIVTGGADTTIAGVGVAAPGDAATAVPWVSSSVGDDCVTTAGVGDSPTVAAVDSTALVAVPSSSSPPPPHPARASATSEIARTPRTARVSVRGIR